MTKIKILERKRSKWKLFQILWPKVLEFRQRGWVHINPIRLISAYMFTYSIRKMRNSGISPSQKVGGMTSQIKNRRPVSKALLVLTFCASKVQTTLLWLQIGCICGIMWSPHQLCDQACQAATSCWPSSQMLLMI